MTQQQQTWAYEAGRDFPFSSTRDETGARRYYARLIDAAAFAGQPLPTPATADEIADAREHTAAAAAARKAEQDAQRADAAAAKSEAREQRAADKAAKARHAEALAYVAGYVGSWGLPLDLRADRRWGTKYMRLSDRQVDALLAGKARDEQRAADLLIAREIYAADAYAAHVALMSAPAADAPQRAPQTATAVTDAGIYRTADGTIYKVQMAVHGSGHLYAKRLVIDGTSGTFEYESGAIRRLTPAMRLTAQDAAAYGRLYGICIVCGATLTDEKSIAAGIGPVCRGRV